MPVTSVRKFIAEAGAGGAKTFLVVAKFCRIKMEYAELDGHGRVEVHVHGEGGEVEVHEVGVFAFVGDVGTVKVGWPEVGELGPVALRRIFH